jgi:hypothetical protein
VALVAVASAGGAYAATQSSTNPRQAYLEDVAKRRQAYLDDVAKRLNVSPAKLRAALKGALIDRLNAAVKRGQLTQAQANKIEQRIEQSGSLPFLVGPPGRFSFPARPLLAAGAVGAAAKYLGLTDAKLFGELSDGKSLAQIAKAQGKSVSGLEQAIISSETTRLNQLESKGIITKAQEQLLLSRLSEKVSRLVNRSGLMMRGPGLRALPNGPLPQNGPMMPPSAGGPPVTPPPVGGPPGPGSAPPPTT